MQRQGSVYSHPLHFPDVPNLRRRCIEMKSVLWYYKTLYVRTNMAFPSNLISPLRTAATSLFPRLFPSGDERVDLPLNETIAFSDCSGVYREGIKRKQLNMIRNYAPLLKQFLEPGEEILLVMRACSPAAFWHEFMTQCMAYYLRRCTLVATDRRILHFPSRTNFKPRFSVSQIRFGDLSRIGITTIPYKQLRLVYKNGKREIFLHVRDVLKLKDILPVLEFRGQAETLVRGRHHLCPRCKAPLLSGNHICPVCKQEFKSERKAVFLALLAPGGGYFYTNHPFLGIQCFLVEIFLLMLLLPALYLGGSLAGRAAGPWPAVVFSAVFLFQKTLTVLHAKQFVREFIPEL